MQKQHGKIKIRIDNTPQPTWFEIFSNDTRDTCNKYFQYVQYYITNVYLVLRSLKIIKYLM